MNLKKVFKLKVFIGLVTIFLYQSCFAQSQKQLILEEKFFLIETASKLLNDNYVFPDVALKVEKYIKFQLVKGVFNGITDQKEFAERLTIEMQLVIKDKHMCCFSKAMRTNIKQSHNSTLFNSRIEKLKDEKHFGFIRSGMLDNSIGVLDIYNFPDLEYSKKFVDEAMNVVSSSKAIIIDLRRNSGGEPEMICYICSYFFDKPTYINSIYWRSSNMIKS